MNSAAPAIASADISIADGEPRIRDVRIGERLGMAQPLNIRTTIEANRAELERYGSIHAVHEPPPKGGKTATVYWLNEPQSLLLCMLSRTAAAADVRQELIAVYMIYRSERRTSAPSDPFVQLTRHQAIIRQAVEFHVETKEPEFAEAITHLLMAGRYRRLPKFWGDIDVRIFLINMHRQMTIDDVMGALSDRFGEQRTPARSSIGRFWKELDQVRGTVVLGNKCEPQGRGVA